MTDRPRPPGPPDPASGAGDRSDAGRDPQVAAALAVPPLDETSRRRLVRAATQVLDEPPATSSGLGTRPVSRLGAAMSVAAVLLVGAVVGAVVVSRPDDPEPTTAARAPSSAPTTLAGAAPAPQSGEDEAGAPEAASGAPPRELGDLGTVASTAALRRAVNDRLDEGVAADRSLAASSTSCRPGDPSVLGLVLVAAAGTAQLDGRSVAVLVGPSPEGDDVVLALDPALGCEIVERLGL